MKEQQKENKYYIPEISEFHVGFEYEIKLEDLWINQSYNSIAMSEIDKGITNQYIRVKYLDKQDIESLGWEIDQYCSKEFCLNFKYKDWYLNYFISGLKTIEIGREEYDSGFMGTIKNKSELKVLMKQLGITCTQ